MRNNKPFVFVIFILSFLMFSCEQKKSSVSFNAMSTFMSVQAYGSKSEEALKAIEKRIENIEKTISTTLEESDLYKMNNNPGSFIKVREDTSKLFEFTLGMYKATDRALNPALYPIISAWGFTTEKYRVPSEDEIRELLSHTDFLKVVSSNKASGLELKLEDGMKLDFGAVGKGFAADESIKILKEYGVESALLDLGGNVQVLGKKPDGSLWTVGIKNPLGGDPVCALKVSDSAVVTSGGYERYFQGEDGEKYIHIFDPETGRPVESDLESVTIVCESGLYADSLSTSLFVMGKEKALSWWQENGGFDFILITKEGDLILSDGIKDRVQVLYPFENVYYAKS